MKVIAPVRRKRKGAEPAPRPAPAPEPAAAPEPAPPEPAPAPEPAPPAAAPGTTRGLLRKSAIRRFLRNEFAFPLQVRDAFFAAAEVEFAEDLRRAVSRALASKRSTLMAPDA